MTVLPTVGGDSGSWGTILNAYLQTEHTANGNHFLCSSLITENINTVANSGATETIAAPSSQTVNDITLTANCALTLPTAVAGQSFILILRQNATGGWTVSWVGNALWSGGIEPTLTSTANAVDVISFLCVDGTNWFGFVSGQDMK